MTGQLDMLGSDAHDEEREREYEVDRTPRGLVPTALEAHIAASAPRAARHAVALPGARAAGRGPAVAGDPGAGGRAMTMPELPPAFELREHRCMDERDDHCSVMFAGSCYSATYTRADAVAEAWRLFAHWYPEWAAYLQSLREVEP